MKYEKNRKIFGIDEVTFQKAGRFLVIPVVVAVLIIVILIADRKPKIAKTQTTEEVTSAILSEEPVTEPVQSSQMISPDEEIYINNFDDYGLQKDAVPAITELITEYQRAKITGDAVLLYDVFGRTDTDGIEIMQEELNAEKEAYEEYSDTACYSTAGIEDGSYVVFISTKLKFKDIDTPAPMLIWAYIVTGEDGRLHMKEPDTLNESEQAYVEKISLSEDVTLLDRQMKSQLSKALAEDSDLEILYNTWSNVEE